MDERTRRAVAHWATAQPAVSAFVHALVADRSERDDVLQDVAVAVLESFGDYDATRPFLPWALGIARREVVDSLRRRQRRPALLGLDASAALAEALAQVEEIERERLERLRHCLERLDGRARQICELRYVDDLKPAQIGARLGMRANSAAKVLQRVREQLRECVEALQRAEGHA